jgi:hypothetical protein
VKHASRVDISAGKLTETHISPCYPLVPEEINSGYGVAVSNSRSESHRVVLGGTAPSMQKLKTVKSKRFVSNAEGAMGKIPTSVLVKLVDSMPHYGCPRS